MKISITFILLITVFVTNFLYGQENNIPGSSTPKIYNFHNKEQFKEFQKRDLDKDHKNLLNPQVAKDDYAMVGKKWVELHQEIGNYLKSIEFDWNTEDTAVTIVHKIYFDKTGAIKAHFFNVLNDNIDADTKEKFSENLMKFAHKYSLKLNKDFPYAQCGKTRYYNKLD